MSAYQDYVRDFGFKTALDKTNAKGGIMLFKELNLLPNEERVIPVSNQVYFLIDADDGVSVSSKQGNYQKGSYTLKEQQREHRTEMTITNLNSEPAIVSFYQLTVE